jgi:hypothetical protein
MLLGVGGVGAGLRIARRRNEMALSDPRLRHI